MNELFRFVSVRPPHTASPKKTVDAKPLMASSPLLAALHKAKDKPARAAIAADFRETAGFVGDATKLKLPLLDIAHAVRDLDDARKVSLARAIETVAETKRGALIQSKDFAADRLRLLESALALREAGEANSDRLKTIYELIAVTKLLEQDDMFGEAIAGKAVKAFLNTVIVKLPKAAENLLPAKQKSAPKAGGSSKSTADERSKKLKELRQARAHLTEIHAEILEDARKRNIGDDDFEDETLSPEQQLNRQKERERKSKEQQKKSGEIVSRLAELGDAVKDVVTAAGLELNDDTVFEAIGVLEEKIRTLETPASLPPGNTRYAYYRGSVIARRDKNAAPKQARSGTMSMYLPDPGLVAEPKPSPDLNFTPPQIEPPAVPEGVGYAHILGVGDLMVVREETKEYAMGDIAHIENIMAGEYKDRSHRRTVKTEETIVTESERETETERDLQSTERFQLSEEATEIIKADSKLEAGFNLSASYGPTVSVGANSSASLSLSTETSKKSASNYSREITERAKNRVVERVREQRSRTTMEEIEEINKHGFDNKSNAEHVVGVYRWVDKIQRARLLNYGHRMMLEFIVPEPAAFFMQALFDAPPQGLTMEEPDDLLLSLNASDLVNDADDPNDYRNLARLYQVTSIEPPPPKYVKQADNMTFAESKENASQTASKKITIASDYRAYKAVFTRSRATSGSGMTIHAACASAAGEITSHKRDFNLSDMQGELPISVTFKSDRAASVHVTVYCERTSEAYARWQIKTYAALLEGYQKMKSRFDEQVAVANLDQANRIDGFSPDRNRSIERGEIKRSVISILTGQHFDQFGAVVGGPPARIDFGQAIAEGKYIQFFENAFEWSNMSYVLYSYFWGRQTTWVEKIGLDGNDPDHLAFLQAGAARVVAPVRPGYEPVLIHYLDTAEIWGGTDVPDLSGVSAPYLEISAPTIQPARDAASFRLFSLR